MSAPDIITEDIALALSDYERIAIYVGEVAHGNGEARARREMGDARTEVEQEIVARVEIAMRERAALAAKLDRNALSIALGNYARGLYARERVAREDAERALARIVSIAEGDEPGALDAIYDIARAAATAPAALVLALGALASRGGAAWT
jgi:hypothetical protein